VNLLLEASLSVQFRKLVDSVADPELIVSYDSRSALGSELFHFRDSGGCFCYVDIRKRHFIFNQVGLGGVAGLAAML
tara:strand:- start:377 stop:607 length:231 start_codon:yes stop_codon:yes gene_type:complete